MVRAIALIVAGAACWFLAGPVYAWTWDALKLLSLALFLLMRGVGVILALIGTWRLIATLIDHLPDR